MSSLQNATIAGVTIDSAERLSSMSRDEVDDLPYGFLILDREGTIVLYNRYESRMSRLPAERVLGRSWFSEIAPCTRVEAFFGRFRAFADDPSRDVERFAFRFHFLHGAQDVLVQLARAPGEADRIMMTVVRREVGVASHDAAPSVRLDEQRGAVLGPLGPALAFPSALVVGLLADAGEHVARRTGADIARLLIERARAAATLAGEEAASSPPLLTAGVLDAAMADAGLGRLALDTTARATKGVIGIYVRPPVPTLTRALSWLYEGLLSTALSEASGEALVARCLDTRSTALVPWLFAAVSEERVAVLAPVAGESAESIGRRLGLVEADADALAM